VRPADAIVSARERARTSRSIRRAANGLRMMLPWQTTSTLCARAIAATMGAGRRRSRSARRRSTACWIFRRTRDTSDRIGATAIAADPTAAGRSRTTSK
jgi:hypothetical protein